MGGIVVGGPQGSRAGSRAVPEIAVLNGPGRGSDQIVKMQDRLSKLVGIFEGLDFRANRAHGDDLLGDAHEYLMRHFATQSGKSKGQFYTPAEVSRIHGPGDRDRPGYEAGRHRVRPDLRLRVSSHQGR